MARRFNRFPIALIYDSIPTVPPIAYRELLIACRRRGTFSLRVWSAGAALGLFVFLYLVPILGSRASAIGQGLLYTIATILFIYCAIVGAVTTADSLARERSEGTLGLLFLTPLRSYDITLGKLTAAGLAPCYGLVAAIPIIALPMLVGGVSNTQVGLVVAVLFTTLFQASCVGLAASVLCREPEQALSVSLIFLAVLIVPFPFIDAMNRAPTPFDGIASFSLYWLLLDACSGWPQPQFPTLLGGNVLVGVGALGIATCRLLGLALQPEVRTTTPESLGKDSQTAPATSPKLRRGPDREFPFDWLARRTTPPSKWLSLTAIAVLIFSIQGIEAFGANDLTEFALCLYPVHILFKMIVAYTAVRTLKRHMQSGALELLATTPTPLPLLAAALFRELRYHFRYPAAILMLINMIVTWKIGVQFIELSGPRSRVELFPALLAVIGGMILLHRDLNAFIWAGLVAGLRNSSTARAFASVVLPPFGFSWIGIMVLLGSVIGLHAGPGTFAFGLFFWQIWMCLTAAHIARVSERELGIRLHDGALAGGFRVSDGVGNQHANLPLNHSSA